MKLFVKYLFIPFVITSCLVLTYFFIQILDQKWYYFIPGLVVFFYVFIFILLEKYFPYNHKWQEGKKDFKTDLLQTFVALPIASKLAEVLIPLLLIYPASLFSNWLNIDFLDSMPFFFQFAVVLVFCELFFYWIHRWSHVSPFLWKFHAVHHGAERVYWANSGRFHFVDAFYTSFMYYLPAFFMGASIEVFILIITFSGVTGFLEHINIYFKAGPLNYVFNTAELHRWHHSTTIEESNKNYGKSLIVWDIVFGTYFNPQNRQPQTAGIENEKVPNHFKGQMMYPFIRRKNDR